MEASNSPVTIIIADDHPVTRDGLALMLTTESQFVIVGQAEDGLEAVDLYRRFLPAVLVLDLQMPKLNGFGVTKKLRGDFPDARILLFTTYDGDEDIHRAMHAGARGYLLKDARRPGAGGCPSSRGKVDSCQSSRGQSYFRRRVCAIRIRAAVHG